MGKKFCFALLFLFAISFTVADSLFGILKADGVYVTVPDLCGKQESQLDLPQWAMIETAYRYSDQAPVGVVMQQSPEAGHQLKVGRNKKRMLTLTVSLGAETKTVPNVLGQDVRLAAATLREHGFSVVTVQKTGGKEGEVVAIYPNVGTALPAGGEVTLTVSQGTPAQTVTVPDLTGLSRSTALLELFRCGLSVGEVIEELSDAPEGTVIRQSPSAGSIVAPNTKLKLTVSQGLTAGIP